MILAIWRCKDLVCNGDGLKKRIDLWTWNEIKTCLIFGSALTNTDWLFFCAFINSIISYSGCSKDQSNSTLANSTSLPPRTKVGCVFRMNLNGKSSAWSVCGIDWGITSKPQKADVSSWNGLIRGLSFYHNDKKHEIRIMGGV